MLAGAKWDILLEAVVGGRQGFWKSVGDVEELVVFVVEFFLVVDFADSGEE